MATKQTSKESDNNTTLSSKKEEVELLRQQILQQGDQILNETLPEKISSVNQMLQLKIFKKSPETLIPAETDLPSLEILIEAHKNARTPKKETTDNQSSKINDTNAVGHVKKKRKLDAREELNSSDDSHSDSDDDFAHSVDTAKFPIIPCNKKVIEVIDTLKVEVISAFEIVSNAKFWIQLMIPRMEDGNNFGVSVQEECLGELSRIEEQGYSMLENMTKYFQTRAKFVSKLLKYPTIMDYRQTVIECDQMEIMDLRFCAIDLRNNYMVMYDLLQKNLERIKAPRNSHNNAMTL